MKLEIYSVPRDEEANKIKNFLIENNLKFREILTEDVNIFNKARQAHINRKKAILKITYSSAIHIVEGFNKFYLQQLLEHIKKYNPKLK